MLGVVHAIVDKVVEQVARINHSRIKKRMGWHVAKRKKTKRLLGEYAVGEL